MLNLKNPVVFFVIIWTSVLLLYKLQLSFVLLPLQSDTLVYLFLICLAYLLSYVFVKLRFSNLYLPKVNHHRLGRSIKKNLKYVFYFWSFFSLLEIAYFGSLPILSIFGIGKSMTYTDFGIPSLHGFLNAIIITLSNYYFYFYFKSKEKKYLYFYLLCLAWPLMLLTRQMFLSMILQAVFTYIFLNRIKTKLIFKVIILGLFIVFLFGYLGDLRSGEYSFSGLAQPTENFPKWLPSGFLWVYIYVVSPLNNLNFNIHKFPGFNLDFSPLIKSALPSVLKEFFETERPYNFELVNEYLNVSTFFPGSLLSFGYYGSMIFHFVLGLSISYIYIKFKQVNSNIKWLFLLGIAFHNIIFSVFVDFFFSLVFIFQMFLHFNIGKTFKFNNR